jgi:hypothetical protein
MTIHLYTWSWNDGHMLPFLFRHYDPFIERYVVYDDGSTDDALDILHAHDRVEIRNSNFTSDPNSLVNSGMAVAQECWKESRGSADWVIVTEIDEHLYHREFASYLASCRSKGVTIIPALGYQMLSDSFPSADVTLCRSLTRGAPWSQMNKLNIFSPDAVEQINYASGRHSCRPVGNIVLPERDELLLLHYKYLGFERTHQRHEQYAARLREADVAGGFGHKWLWSKDQLRADWQQFEAALVDISADVSPWLSHEEPRWWEGYPRIGDAMAGQAKTERPA